MVWEQIHSFPAPVFPERHYLGLINYQLRFSEQPNRMQTRVQTPTSVCETILVFAEIIFVFVQGTKV